MLQTPASFTPLMTPRSSPDALSFIFHAGRLLVREADLALPDADAVTGLHLDPARLQPVGLLGERYCQTGWVDDEGVAPAGYAWRGLRSLFGELDETLLGVAMRAVQVAEWARTHRFCGACGSGTALAGGERCFKCVNCGHMAYPRISPAMMVLIRKGDAVLLALHTQSAVQRFVPLHPQADLLEHLAVQNLRYFGSQSWPFPHSLMIAFTADYLDGEIRTDPTEILEARWFGPLDEWPERVPHVSISSILVDAHRPGGAD
jgi:NAD+ diphosphatase